MRFGALALLGLGMLACAARAADTRAEPVRLGEWVDAATGDDAAAAKSAIAALRAAGPTGLGALMTAHADLVGRHRTQAAPVAAKAADDAAWPRVAAAIDAVAAQKDAYASGLYWYTDLGAAERAAKASGKPILSLRLLGTLDSEFSCANSRFFRTALYANREVAEALRTRYVLHWKSVRPVPRITIDFGDGRVVERTITGNSIHYVLDADGRVIDAIPGLYGPRAFLAKLTEAEQIEAKARALAVAEREPFLRQWHAEKAGQALSDWRADLLKAGVPVSGPVVTMNATSVGTTMPGGVTVNNGTVNTPSGAVTGAGGTVTLAGVTLAGVTTTTTGTLTVGTVETAVAAAAAQQPPAAAQAAPLAKSKFDLEGRAVWAIAPGPAGVAVAAAPPPTARAAGLMARGKGTVEMPLVLSIAMAPDAKSLERASDEAAWAKVAALHADDARLDDRSRALVAAKNPESAKQANERTMSKRFVEAPLVRIVRNFERSIAEDTVRNEYTFHRQIHGWLAAGPDAPEANLAGDVAALNERVYAELFLTPSSDPWLGLVPPDTYSALPNDGVCAKK